jgi:hypothetical protein
LQVGPGDPTYKKAYENAIMQLGKEPTMKHTLSILTALLLAVPSVLHAADHLSDRASLENSDLVYDQPAGERTRGLRP